MKRQLDKAADAFEEFTGHQAREFYKTDLPDTNQAGYKLGPMVGIAYQAKKDGKTDQYFHRFKKRARPDLVATSDGKQLYIAGGDYRITDRGIEDNMPALFVVNPSSRKARPMARRVIRRRRRTTQTAIFKANPVRRRRKRRAVTVYRSNPVRRRVGRARRRMSFRRNPSGGLGGLGSFTKLLLPAIGIGMGAVGTEALMGALPIPAALKTGPVRHLTKAGLAIGVGFGMAKFLRMKRLGEMFALGGVVIAAHDVAKELIVRFAPATRFGMYVPPMPGLGYYNAGQTVDNSRMGMYMSPVQTGMGGGERVGNDDFSGT